MGRAARPPFAYGRPARTIAAAARFLDRAGFALLMPHRGLPMPSLFEAIRGRTGGHPFRPWTKDSDRMWEWKDGLPKRGLAYYGTVWGPVPGMVSRGMLPRLLRLWECPLGLDGFRSAYREGRLSFDASRICEAVIRTGPINTYKLRKRIGLSHGTFHRAFVELQRKLVIAKCGTEPLGEKWEAEVLDLTARVFPKAHAEAGELSVAEAREEALMKAAETSRLSPRQVARLFHTTPLAGGD